MAKGRPVQPAERPVSPPTAVFRRERITITKSLLAGEELAKIEAVVPGGADRMLTVMEKQSDHRQKIEGQVISSNILGERVGQLTGFLIAALGMYFGYSLLMADKPIAGYTLALTPIAALATVFVIGKGRRHRDLKSKDMHG